MNTQNTKVNSILFRRELSKLAIESADTRQAVERFNNGHGFRKTKDSLLAQMMCISISLMLTVFGKADMALGMTIGIALSLMFFSFPTFRKEKEAENIFKRVVEDIEAKTRAFIAAFPGSEQPMQWASTVSEADKAHQFILDYARKEVIIKGRKIQAGDESLQTEMKIMVAAATLLFGKSFDRNLSFKLFFNEEIVSEMCYFRKELGYPEDGDSAKTE